MKKESSKSKKHVMKQVSIEDMKMSEGLADTALVIRKATNMTASIHATSHGLGGVQQATAALTTTNTSSSIEDTVQQSAYKKPIKRLSSVEKNIWDEYYPLLASNSTSHNSSLGFSGMFSAEIVTAYKHAILAYVIALMTMVVLSITGLVLSKLWDLHPSNICVTLSITLWIISPVIASFAARQGTSSNIFALSLDVPDVMKEYHLNSGLPAIAILCRWTSMEYPTFSNVIQMFSFPFHESTFGSKLCHSTFVHGHCLYCECRAACDSSCTFPNASIDNDSYYLTSFSLTCA